MAYSYEDKVAIITGGSRGIGEATARLLVERGARVVIADVLEDEGRSLAAELGDRALFQKLDVSVQSEWEETLRAACDLGVLSVLVNNAAILIQATVLDMTEEQFVASFRVNQLGVFLGMRAAFPALKQAGGGSIVNVSSIDGLQSMNSLTAYSATKWAVRGMTKAAAIEMGKYGIRVNSVHPGGIYTPMHASDLISVEEAGTFYADSALPRVGMPDEVARMIAFVASDESSFSTGSEFITDGGTSAGKLNRIAPQL